MGALHGGHMALVAQARRRARRVVVSIFVNPAQFAPQRGFRQLSARYKKGPSGANGSTKVDLVWAPSAAVMYPEGFATRIEPAGAAGEWDFDRCGPATFSAASATVVAKLFRANCRPTSRCSVKKALDSCASSPKRRRISICRSK